MSINPDRLLTNILDDSPLDLSWEPNTYHTELFVSVPIALGEIQARRHEVLALHRKMKVDASFKYVEDVSLELSKTVNTMKFNHTVSIMGSL